MSEVRQLFDDQNRALSVASNYLRESGFTIAPDIIDTIASGRMLEFVENATECAVAIEREKIEQECAIKLAAGRIMLRLEYEACVGEWPAGWATHGWSPAVSIRRIPKGAPNV